MISISRHISRSSVLLAQALLLALASPGLAAPDKNNRMEESGTYHCRHMHGGTSRISVTGEGVVRVTPDLAAIRIGVQTQAATASEASDLNARSQQAVIDALKAAGVDEKDIQTSGYNLGPVMNYPENAPQEVTGYLASNIVSVQVTELERLGELLDSVIAAGSNQIEGINFSRQDSTGPEDQARTLAIADARHKAAVMAEAAGLELGQVLVIADSASSGGATPRMYSAMAKDASTPIQAGELSVSARVEMEFALLDTKAMMNCHPEPGKPHAPKESQGN